MFPGKIPKKREFWECCLNRTRPQILEAKMIISSLTSPLATNKKPLPELSRKCPIIEDRKIWVFNFPKPLVSRAQKMGEKMRLKRTKLGDGKIISNDGFIFVVGIENQRRASKSPAWPQNALRKATEFLLLPQSISHFPSPNTAAPGNFRICSSSGWSDSIFIWGNSIEAAKK